jgi:hypothetical protein
MIFSRSSAAEKARTLRKSAPVSLCSKSSVTNATDAPADSTRSMMMTVST